MEERGDMMIRTYVNLPVAQYDDVLSWDQGTVDRLLRHAYEIAMKVGCHIEEEEYLREIESKGGRIDWSRRAVVPTERQLDEVCEVLRKTARMQARFAPVRSAGFEPVGIGNGGNMIFDWESWQAKAPTVQDLVRVCNFAQGNDDVRSLFDPFMPKDINIVLEPVFTYAVMARHCRKRVYHPQATEPEHVVYLDKMARIVERHRGYYQPMLHYEYVNPPFRLGGRGIRTMLARIDTGICNKMGLGPMSVSGMSAPITAVGTAVTAVAEVLCALSALHIMRPEPGLTTNACTGELDLASARVKYFALRTHKQNIAMSEIVRRGIGAECNFLTWYRDANEPGLQACYEYGYSQALFTALKGRTYAEVGGLACGNMFSPEQAILDIEIIKEFDDLLAGFDASDEAVAVEEIIRAGFEQGYHLTSEHTLAHMREHLAASDFFLRGYPAGAEHDKRRTQTQQLMEKAREKSLLSSARGKETPADEELGNELWECVEEAADELGIERPECPKDR
ncbi:MAG: trimethylamine methyltransferase family protein [Planctomycetota bacterium]